MSTSIKVWYASLSPRYTQDNAYSVISNTLLAFPRVLSVKDFSQGPLSKVISVEIMALYWVRKLFLKLGMIQNIKNCNLDFTSNEHNL